MNQVTEKKSAPLPTNMFEEDAAKGLGKISNMENLTGDSTHLQ